MGQTAEANFDPETVALLKRILVEAEESLPLDVRSPEVTVRLASRILTAAADGERDPKRLRSAALRVIDRRIVRFGSSWIDRIDARLLIADLWTRLISVARLLRIC